MKSFCLVLILVSMLYPQDNPNVDTVILIDGSTIKGTIVEFVSGKYIRITTTGGSEIQIDMAEVESIQRGPIILPNVSPQNNQYDRNHLNYKAKISFCKYGWATTAGITLIGSAAMGDKSFSTTVIPVVGPFMTISQIESDSDLDYLPGAKNMLLASGILQASFVSCWILYEILDMSAEPQHALTIYPQTEKLGLTAVYRF